MSWKPKDDRGADRWLHAVRRPLPPGTLQKVKADTVPYGPETCRVGNSVWVGYSATGEVVVMAATRREVEGKYRVWQRGETNRLWMERKARDGGGIPPFKHE